MEAPLGAMWATEEGTGKFMGICRDCAFRRKNGECVMRHAECPYTRCYHACTNWVARLTEAQHRHVRCCIRNMEACTDKDGRLQNRRKKAGGWTVFRTCRRKRRFRDVHAAMKQAIEIYRREGVVLAVYECPFCGGYHLTRQLRPYLLRVRASPRCAEPEVA